jgi:hypothetical protein
LKFEHSEIDSEGNFESKIELTDIDLLLVLDFLELLESQQQVNGWLVSHRQDKIWWSKG